MSPETFLSKLIPNIDNSYQFKIKYKNSAIEIKSELYINYTDITEIEIFKNKNLIDKLMVNTTFAKSCRFKDICEQFKKVVFITNRNRVLVEVSIK
jgi:hypothetical protein